MNKFTRWVMLAVCLSIMALSGCGQKGALYPPSDEDQMRRDKRI